MNNPDNIDNLIDTGLALLALWFLIDPDRFLTIPVCLALTMGWFLAYREMFNNKESNDDE